MKAIFFCLILCKNALQEIGSVDATLLQERVWRYRSLTTRMQEKVPIPLAGKTRQLGQDHSYRQHLEPAAKNQSLRAEGKPVPKQIHFVPV